MEISDGERVEIQGQGQSCTTLPYPVVALSCFCFHGESPIRYQIPVLQHCLHL